MFNIRHSFVTMKEDQTVGHYLQSRTSGSLLVASLQCMTNSYFLLNKNSIQHEGQRTTGLISNQSILIISSQMVRFLQRKQSTINFETHYRFNRNLYKAKPIGYQKKALFIDFIVMCNSKFLLLGTLFIQGVRISKLMPSIDLKPSREKRFSAKLQSKIVFKTLTHNSIKFQF